MLPPSSSPGPRLLPGPGCAEPLRKSGFGSRTPPGGAGLHLHTGCEGKLHGVAAERGTCWEGRDPKKPLTSPVAKGKQLCSEEQGEQEL